MQEVLLAARVQAADGAADSSGHLSSHRRQPAPCHVQQQRGIIEAGRMESGAAAAAAAAAAATTAAGPASSMFGWLARGIRKIAVAGFNLLCTFIFGPNGPRGLGGPASGAAFSRALTTTYGPNLQLPRFFEGSFAQALQAAQRDLKLLVVFLHSEHARDARSFCSTVICNDVVRTMLDENFLLWGGDIARMETHYVSQMIHARQYPCLCVLLPASVDEVRVIGAVQGEVQVDATISLLAACFEEMETHRAEMVARSAQQVEDRHLREQQDQEYQEALEMDRKRAEQQAAQERAEREAREAAEAEKRKEEEQLARIEAERVALEEERRQQAARLGAEGEDATARVALRLPAGQRAQRKFRPTATLADVYAWAGCVGHLPENEGRSLEIPRRFMLKTSFPTRDLVEMESTIQDLQLAGTNLVLAEIEEDED
mmetsp:Transcript_83654/g.210858  ORF Transcript_83654/g.210858 Transcript_83654/m.210858 type:complete len:430 (+) Transcript_83654:95-1384(+)